MAINILFSVDQISWLRASRSSPDGSSTPDILQLLAERSATPAFCEEFSKSAMPHLLRGAMPHLCALLANDPVFTDQITKAILPQMEEDIKEKMRAHDMKFLEDALVAVKKWCAAPPAAPAPPTNADKSAGEAKRRRTNDPSDRETMRPRGAAAAPAPTIPLPTEAPPTAAAAADSQQSPSSHSTELIYEVAIAAGLSRLKDL